MADFFFDSSFRSRGPGAFVAAPPHLAYRSPPLEWSWAVRSPSAVVVPAAVGELVLLQVSGSESHRELRLSPPDISIRNVIFINDL